MAAPIIAKDNSFSVKSISPDFYLHFMMQHVRLYRLVFLCESFASLRLCVKVFAFSLRDYFVTERRRSLSLTIAVKSSAGRISNGPAFTPGCFDIN